MFPEGAGGGAGVDVRVAGESTVEELAKQPHPLPGNITNQASLRGIYRLFYISYETPRGRTIY